jgi:hypothetical protein
MGNLAPPVRNAAIEIFSFIPHISNSTVPAETLAPQCDTCPLPLPIRTPVGFDVIGKSGNIFIHSFPFLFIFLTIACLAASICLEFIIPDSSAFNPIFPNFILLALNSSFFNFPFFIFFIFSFSRSV